MFMPCARYLSTSKSHESRPYEACTKYGFNCEITGKLLITTSILQRARNDY